MSNLGCGGCDEITLPLGQDGNDGKNAFTITTSIFSQPAVGSPIPINVSNIGQFTNQWASPGQIIYIKDSSGNGGWYSVVSITGETSITINNLDYPGSTQVGLPINSSASVSPSGPRGAAGTAGGAGTAGQPGSQGLPGINGTTLLRSVLGVTNTTATYANVATITAFAANELCPQNGNKSTLEATVYMYSSDSASGNIRLLLNGVSITQALVDVGVLSEPTFSNYIGSGDDLGGSGVIKVDIYRRSSTVASVTVFKSDIDGKTLSYNSGNFTTDFASAITLQIQARIGKPGVARIIGCNTLTVTSFK